MKQIENVFEMDFDKIDIDPFWNVGDEKEHTGHRIHAYPAKFPAFITQKALKYAENQSIEVSCIADVFCGCGTVAFEAKRYGIDFWGCDINPVAVLIAKAKSLRYSAGKHDYYVMNILQKYDDLYEIFTCGISDNGRISYWFSDENIKRLSLLKKCILEVVPEKSKYRNYFLCAFSNILKPTSRWLTKAIKPQIDPQKSPADVRKAFVKQCTYMRRAVQEGFTNECSKVIIKEKNALAIKNKSFVDLIVTSPPYVTSYEYADLHQLSTLWLDYAYDYRDLRLDSIGSNHNVFNGDSMIKKLNFSGSEIVDTLYSIDKSKAKAVAKYYYDMQRIASVCYGMLKENGMILLVIGNTEYKGVHINNAKHLAESLFNSGFDNVSITKRKITNKILTPYRDSGGKFSSNNSDRKVYAEEFILVGRK